MYLFSLKVIILVQSELKWFQQGFFWSGI